jgi:hypothetical protein
MVKRFLFFALLLVSVLVLSELTFWGFFTFSYKTTSNTSGDAKLEKQIKSIPHEDIEKFISGQYDPELGWNAGSISYQHEGTTYKMSPERVRINPYQSSIVRISAYGDSFTFGDEVENNETYPFFLSQLSQSNVINYGVPAYGTDQALKKLEQNLKKGKRTDVVVLEFIQDSVRRNMNMYLVFKYGFDSWTRYMFKPMLYKDSDGYKWVENPLRKLESAGDILKAYEESKKYDWFYNHPHPEIFFPYSVSAIKTLQYRLKQKYGGTPDWGHKESERKMKELIKIYSGLSKKYNFIPVIVYIPAGFEIKDQLAGPRSKFRFNEFIEEITEDYKGSNMIVIDASKEIKSLNNTVSLEKFYVRPYDGHPSAYGNRVIAGIIYGKIKSKL